MSKKIFTFLIIIFLIVFGFLIFNFRKNTVAGFSWSSKTVDSAGNVGRYTSISVVDINNIFISYYDETNYAIKFAKSTDGGLTWKFSTVDWNTYYGANAIYAVDANNIFIGYSGGPFAALEFAKSTDGGLTWKFSTAVDGDGPEFISIYAVDVNNIFISYLEIGAKDLKFAKSTDGGLSWTAKAVDKGGSVGWATSIHAVDVNKIFISYWSFEANEVRFAKSTDGGLTWKTSNVDSVGSYTTSLYAADQDNIVISYFTDVAGGNIVRDLRFAKSTDGGLSWTISIIDSEGDVGWDNSLHAIDINNLLISYYDSTNGDLKFAKSIDGGSIWETSIVDSTGDVGAYTSISAADINNIFISYYDKTNSDLKFAKSGPFGISPPMVTTSRATGITSSQATLNGDITSTGGENISERGFEWGTTLGGPYPNPCPNPLESGNFGTGPFSCNLSGLTLGQTYYFRAKAKNSAGWGYGGEMSFTTLTDCGLRVFDGTSVIAIACEPAGTLTSPLRIRKGGTTYGIILVPVTDVNASKIRIQTSSGIKALRKY